MVWQHRLTSPSEHPYATKKTGNASAVEMRIDGERPEVAGREAFGKFRGGLADGVVTAA